MRGLAPQLRAGALTALEQGGGGGEGALHGAAPNLFWVTFDEVMLGDRAAGNRDADPYGADRLTIH